MFTRARLSVLFSAYLLYNYHTFVIYKLHYDDNIIINNDNYPYCRNYDCKYNINCQRRQFYPSSAVRYKLIPCFRFLKRRSLVDSKPPNFHKPDKWRKIIENNEDCFTELKSLINKLYSYIINSVL
jgi:hypothetical protein